MKILLKKFLKIFLILIIISMVSCQSEPLELGVLTGENVFSKQVFFQDPDLGPITAIKIVDSDSSSQSEILVVGRTGSSLLNIKGEVLHKTLFKEKGGTIIPVFNPESNRYDYLNKGGGWQPVSYITDSGNTLLSISEPTPNDAIITDVNNDNIPDLVIGSNASGGLVAFNLQGDIIWKKNAMNSFDVEIFEENGNKKIVHTDGSEIIVRSNSGEYEKSLKLPFETFDKGYWPGEENDAIIGMHQTSIKAFTLQGKKLGTYPIAREGRTLTTVKLLNNNGEENFGVIVCLRASSNRSEFYVFTREKILLFHEVIPAKHGVAETLETDENGKLVLIGGSDGLVWSYKQN